jgi:hypothetical protein
MTLHPLVEHCPTTHGSRASSASDLEQQSPQEVTRLVRSGLVRGLCGGEFGSWIGFEAVIDDWNVASY